MISIIIPVFNVEQYLDICVESVCKLNTDVEIILVDDGSTDGSGMLCDAWAQRDSRIRVIHQKNGGLSAARNTGIQSAQGEYLLFLDSDDFLDPEQTDRMLTRIQPGVNVLLGLYRNYYSNDECYEPESCASFLSMEGVVPMEQFLAQIPSDGRSSILTAWRFVCGREFLLQHDLFFLPGIYHEDEEWTSRLFCYADSVTVTHQYFYQYRQNRAGAITSSVKPKHLMDSFTIIERMEKLRKESAPYLQDYLQRRMAMLYLNIMIHLFSVQREQRSMVLEKLRYFHDICASAMTGTIGSAAKQLDNLFGLRFACFALHTARRMLGRR